MFGGCWTAGAAQAAEQVEEGDGLGGDDCGGAEEEGEGEGDDGDHGRQLGSLSATPHRFERKRAMRRKKRLFENFFLSFSFFQIFLTFIFFYFISKIMI